MSILALAALVFDRNLKLAFLSDGQSVGPMIQMVMFALLAAISFRAALIKSEPARIRIARQIVHPRKAAATGRAGLGVWLCSRLAVVSRIGIGIRREFSDHTQGLRYEAKGEHDNAIASFTKAIEAYPNDPAAYAGAPRAIEPRASTTWPSPT